MSKRGRPFHPDVLTPREWEVLSLIRDGLTNEQIAERIGVTIHAARYHVSQILSRLGVSTREEAATWQPEAPRRQTWHRALGIGLTAAAAIAVLAVVVLAWAVLRSSDSDASDRSSQRPGNLDDNILKMQLVSPEMGWALTGDELVRVDLSTDGGTSDAINITPDGITASGLTAVTFASARRGFALVEERVESQSFATANHKRLLETSDGGLTWRTALDLGRGPLLSGGEQSHAALSSFDEKTTLLQVGDDAAPEWRIVSYLTTDGGDNWEMVDDEHAATLREKQRSDASFTRHCPPGCAFDSYTLPRRLADGRLIGAVTTTADNVLVTLRVDQSTDDGDTWTTLAASEGISIDTIDVLSVQVLPGGSVTAFTFEGKNAIRFDAQTGRFDRLIVRGLDGQRGMTFITPTLGWAIDNPCYGQKCSFYPGSLVQTNDGGETWAPVITPKFPSPTP